MRLPNTASSSSGMLTLAALFCFTTVTLALAIPVSNIDTDMPSSLERRDALPMRRPHGSPEEAYERLVKNFGKAALSEFSWGHSKEQRIQAIEKIKAKVRSGELKRLPGRQRVSNPELREESSGSSPPSWVFTGAAKTRPGELQRLPGKETLPDLDPDEASSSTLRPPAWLSKGAQSMERSRQREKLQQIYHTLVDTYGTRALGKVDWNSRGFEAQMNLIRQRIRSGQIKPLPGKQGLLTRPKTSRKRDAVPIAEPTPGESWDRELEDLEAKYGEKRKRFKESVLQEKIQPLPGKWPVNPPYRSVLTRQTTDDQDDRGPVAPLTVDKKLERRAAQLDDDDDDDKWLNRKANKGLNKFYGYVEQKLGPETAEALQDKDRFKAHVKLAGAEAVTAARLALNGAKKKMRQKLKKTFFRPTANDDEASSWGSSEPDTPDARQSGIDGKLATTWRNPFGTSDSPVSGPKNRPGDRRRLKRQALIRRARPQAYIPVLLNAWWRKIYNFYLPIYGRAYMDSVTDRKTFMAFMARVGKDNFKSTMRKLGLRRGGPRPNPDDDLDNILRKRQLASRPAWVNKKINDV